MKPVILLVEDNDAIRGAFSILLSESGYEVRTAASGNDALTIAGRGGVDLVLLDIGLPDISGLDVARTLRGEERTKRLPIVALTGRALELDAQACRQAGCTDFLTKPIDTEQLLRRIPGYIQGDETAG